MADAKLTLPAGVRLAYEFRGELLRVWLSAAGRPVAAFGDFPQRPKAVLRRGRADDGGGLFAAVDAPAAEPAKGPVILVLAALRDQDEAFGVANTLYRLGYDAEARTDPEAN